MMPCKYLMANGATGVLDLDAVYDIINGWSGKRADWTALIVFDAKSSSFIELRSSPPDVRGGSADEAEAVLDDYLTTQFGLNGMQLQTVRDDPSAWQFIKGRQLY